MTAFYEYCRDLGDGQLFSFDAPNVCEYHFHGQFEFAFVTRGEYSATVNGRSRTLLPGDMAFADSFDAHMFFPAKSGSASTVVTVPNRFLDGFTKYKKGRSFRDNFIRDPGRSPVFSDLLAVIEKADKKNAFLLSGLFQSLLGLIAEAVPLEASERAASLDFTRRVLFYFEQHLTEDIDLGTAAAAFGYSENYFSTLFHRSFQSNFSTYLGSLRARYAARLIDEGSPVLAAALEAGFSSPSTFYRAYNRVFGAPPSAPPNK